MPDGVLGTHPGTRVPADSRVGTYPGRNSWLGIPRYIPSPHDGQPGQVLNTSTRVLVPEYPGTPGTIEPHLSVAIETSFFGSHWRVQRVFPILLQESCPSEAMISDPA
eukprot:1495611-Rhodomonas_salina.1